MTSVAFKDLVVNDTKHPMSLESALRRLAAVAGVHYLGAENTASGWGQQSATGSGTWAQVRYGAVNYPLVFEMDVNGYGGVVLWGTPGSSACWIVWWDGANAGMTSVDAQGNETVLLQAPCSAAEQGRLSVLAMQIRDSFDYWAHWLSAGLWLDGEMLVAFSVNVSSYGLAFDGTEIGIAALNGTMTASNLTVSELAYALSYASADPGEAVSAGMGRAIGGGRATVRARYDGSVIAMIPGDRAVDASVPLSVSRTSSYTLMVPDKTNVEIAGAFVEGYSFPYQAIGSKGRHFAIVDSPNVETADAAVREALLQVRDSLEASRTLVVEGPVSVFLEPGDVVTFDGTDWRVQSIDRSVTMGIYNAILKAIQYIPEASVQ